MSIYIAIVSHGHSDLIRELGTVKELAECLNICIAVLDNLGEASLEAFCDSNNIDYLLNNLPLGFGTNNNKIYSFLKNKHFIKPDDYFVILNPDVIIDCSMIKLLVEQMGCEGSLVGTCNLFKDYEFKVFDNSIRSYPSFFDFFKSFLLGENPTIIDKSKYFEPMSVDWAAGSFLCFKAGHYEKLGGFDQRYFMYCEDIDICLRSDKLFNEKVMYFPNVYALHLAKHSNRSLFSRHFFWHVKSIARYLYIKRKLN